MTAWIKFAAAAIAAVCITITSFVSCTTEHRKGIIETADNTFTVEYYKGSSDTIECIFTGEWSARILNGNYSIAPDSGSAGTEQIKVTALAPNNSIYEQVTSINFDVDKNRYPFFIIQQGQPGIEIEQDKYGIAYDAKELSVSFSSNVPVQVKTDSDWIKIKSIEKSEPELLDDECTYSKVINYSVALGFSENTQDQNRTGYIKIISSSDEENITINQEAPIEVQWDKSFYRRSGFIRFTATWCYNCPIMSEALSIAGTIRPDRIIPINIHAMSSGGGLGFWMANEFEKMYDIQAYPTGIMNNMMKISNERPAESLAEVIVNATDEATASYTSMTSLQVYSNINGNIITVDTYIAARKDGEYLLSILLLEDNIQFPQEGCNDDYVHNGILRSLLTEPVEGTPISIQSPCCITKYSLEKDLPRSVADKDNLYVIAIVSRKDCLDTKGVEKAEYLDTEYIWDNVTILPANGSVLFRYE